MREGLELTWTRLAGTEGVTQTASVVGTVAYMSLEQAGGEESITGRTAESVRAIWGQLQFGVALLPQELAHKSGSCRKPQKPLGQHSWHKPPKGRWLKDFPGAGWT